MIRITCPNCGPRNSDEFRHGGESRPTPPLGATPQEWRAYLYLRDNPMGWTTETWYHTAGCRRFFRLERHTVTHEMRVPDATGGQE
jgi:heterotetrameric sarcosine oxidase delta subunit